MLNKRLITSSCALLLWSLSFPFVALCSKSCHAGVRNQSELHACCDRRSSSHEISPDSRCECSLQSHRLPASEVSFTLLLSGKEDARSSSVGAALSSQSALEPRADYLPDTLKFPLTRQGRVQRSSSLRI